MSNVLFNISYCNKASNQIVFKSKGISVFFWIILSHEVSRHFPTYTPTQQHKRTSRIFCIFAVHTGGYTPSLVENLMSCGRRRNKFFWIVSSRLLPHGNFPKHSRKSRTVQCETKSREKSPHGSQICIYNNKKQIDK